MRTAVQAARRNQELNSITNVTFREGNTFDLLKEYDEVGRRFQMVILDPPAFAKNRDSLEAAERGYKEINLRALKILAAGRISGHVFVLLPLERGAVPAVDRRGRERREEERGGGGEEDAGAGPPNIADDAGNALP